MFRRVYSLKNKRNVLSVYLARGKCCFFTLLILHCSTRYDGITHGGSRDRTSS